MRINKSLLNLFNVLNSAELKKEKITKETILSATAWKPSTFDTYWKKGQLSPFLSAELDSGPFDVSNCLSITPIEFAKKLSQSKHVQDLGHNCSSKLAKALLKRSRENMILALEIYNRPSLENRLDCFILCFCSSWEQLLKARIIEEHGENTIYDEKAKMKYGKTISLRKAVSILYDEKSIIRKNIEKVAFYRDFAAHLVMPEVQGLLSRIFQSGVMNYAKEFEAFSELPFLNQNQSGLLSIVGNIESTNITNLKQTYGDSIGFDIGELIEELKQEIEHEDNISFAVPLSVRLVFAKQDNLGQAIIISKAEDGIEGLEKAIIIEKPVDIEKTHPYKETAAIEKINTSLYSQLTEIALKEYLVATKKHNGKPCFSSYDFRLIVEKNGWKNSNNKYHH